MVKVPNGYEVIHMFEQFSPLSLAMEDDQFGLQIGTLNKKIHNVMVTLDLLENVVDEAIDKSIDLIISHHPPIFRPIKHIRTDSTSGKIIEKCIKHDIAVYSAHSNLDITVGGVNDLLAEALKLKDVEILSKTYETKLKKLVVFVPVADEDRVREALGNAGAGHIGNYSNCTFNALGTGTFLPENGSNPYIGHQGRVERVEEVRIETIFPESIQKQVIREMQKAHPYEEVAYDIYPVENIGEAYGLGRIGHLEKSMTLEEFAEFVKTSLDVEGVRVVGDVNAKIQKVAVLGGDGNKYIKQAHFKGADVFVSGDIYYHLAHDAMGLGLNIIDPGHHIEKVMIKGVAKILEKESSRKNYDVKIHESKVNTNPFKFI
ncbi:Nif3-like dinuclear metal center hexameric protein [Bacillus suaedaesalsae]|uniref:GTP cyclohydrolase 1 type 2 homolog n=1 Tax=Bacillus suaedaesalsae TaxID=2810349 RepID=A0ABS2DMI6_9BACI|nr:Nif3-like dinuclear metal center hexameric protein [Bacillus suaedaesalsae]MBM6619275.1 Nif3-like dinuclear metal center hexameric protein [Bacillus suaedaesalsae]